MNDILIVLVGSLFCLWISAKLYTQYLKIFKDFKFINESVDVINSWPTQKAKVLRKEYGMNYVYPEGIYEDVKKFLKADVTEDKYHEEQINNYNANLISDEIGILYGYVVNGNKLLSNNLSYIISDEDMNLFYRVSKGDLINIKVNPDEPAECYALVNSKEDISKQEWRRCKSLFPQLLLVTFFWVLLSYGAFITITG